MSKAKNLVVGRPDVVPSKERNISSKENKVISLLKSFCLLKKDRFYFYLCLSNGNIEYQIFTTYYGYCLYHYKTSIIEFEEDLTHLIVNRDQFHKLCDNIVFEDDD